MISHMYMLYDVYFNCLVSLLTSLTFIQNRQGVIDLKCVCIKLKNLSWLFLRNLEKVIWGKCFINLRKTSLLYDQQNTCIYGCLGNFYFFIQLNVIPLFPSLVRHQGDQSLRNTTFQSIHILFSILHQWYMFFFSNLSNNFVFLIYFFQSMIWPFLALQLLFVCVPSFRQVSYWYTIDVFRNKVKIVPCYFPSIKGAT